MIEGGDLDIDFEVFDPSGKRLIHAEKASDDSHELEIKIAGVYSFCIDNSFSSITSKMVYLDLGIMRDEADQGNSSPIDAVFNVYVSKIYIALL